MNVAIIPARGGSQRIPQKNIKDFCGKPIIGWSIKAALESALFDRVIVSTDSAQIATLSKNLGAEVPFMRPADLADNHTATLPVIRHAIQELKSSGTVPDFVCCLYATAPFIMPKSLKDGYQALKENPDTDFIISATEYRFPIWRSLKIAANGTSEMNWPEYVATRSQDLPPTYHDAGQFYWAKTETFVSKAQILSSRNRLCILPHYHVQDIDTPDDWKRAELAFKTLQMALPNE